ncbi:MAG: transporter permease [Solimicrobium sp.]|jgi:phospholipid/cholesterol/gamma-HCH transport system permease protein|nr:transporter permease [Solimicrobium sp.]
MIQSEPPKLTEIPPSSTSQPKAIVVEGCWQVHALVEHHLVQNISHKLASLSLQSGIQWDLSSLSALDHIGAQLLWNCWGKKRPPQLVLLPLHDAFFRRLEKANALTIPKLGKSRLIAVEQLGTLILNFISHLLAFTLLLGQLILDLIQVVRHPSRAPRKEISASIFQMGFNALAITALVGILIGVVLSYLSAQQLRTFGGDIYIVNILGMSIIRELGPLLAAILVAGRSGSAITAQLGVMRVTEELDAMLVMGIPHGLRLVLPKVIALAITMPLLVVWTDAMALIGGMLSANFILDMSPHFFLQKLPQVVAMGNFYIGLFKGVVFGAAIALIACHFGLRVKPNTESLGRGTTTSVVSAITVVIILDAVFAIAFRKVGYF